ncbi:aryl-sulfate sulfotransferase [Lignipirellula cremea]|uniref:Arylsulfotransferase (ASST) n=1 Tax=Lignipirellula cremea TaxID=2528010 RepID=A0A518E385_9BACT|nr:hypothetical protein [Lignipirellula cremea]QDU98555.1 hypothetical protein Pla8534_64250 [Lignipirellula cremea]
MALFSPKRLPNGNILITAWEKNVDYPGNWEHLIEVKPNYSNWDNSSLPAHGVGGTIVWEWHLLDHLIPEGENSKDYPSKWDPENGAPRINAVQYDPKLNQILISSNNEIWIIKKFTTIDLYLYKLYQKLFTRIFGNFFGEVLLSQLFSEPGDLLYRWGDPATYLGADTSHPQTSFFQHGVGWIDRFTEFGYTIPKGKGVGNILFLNNQFPAGSSVQEFTPPLRRNGSYTQPAYGEPFEPSGLVWQYNTVIEGGLPPAPFLGSAQRLPNGNTLIGAGPSGACIEVTQDRTIVWKYIVPVANGCSRPGSRRC